MAAQAVAAAHDAARIPAPALFPLRDEPSVGPLAAPTTPGFAPLRARFWAETLTFMADAGTPDPEASLPGHYAGLSARLRDAGAATVWLAGSAQEAIALALVEGLAAEAGATLSVALCSWGGGDGGAEGRGLAELPPAALTAPRVTALDASARARLARFREALCARSPLGLEGIAGSPPPAEPLAFLPAAAASRLARRPDPVRGLGSDEARLIDALGPDWAPAAPALGAALRAKGPDRLGDLWLWRLMRELADPAHGAPLAELRGDPARPRAAEARLTGFGRAVQAGEISRLARAGLSRDIGGLRLRLSSPGRRR
ncbi:hypothetical protein SAMN05444336_10950 [Albimonas donghaensis]|uniref:Uncharacterized protein n=1 Tax=Albimonas donghaensis TaxID=356660 RepID=A0A1H3E384_9RHOB|nr:hypothetical protein [Albimonas donghaensis]SDX73131.1 hypothetical protein SAMN05444336_10950 [Albimonas donghaensis]